MQYNSISKHLMLKFISLWAINSHPSFDFKTSYVEVYLARDLCQYGHIEFQNILCWSLSFSIIVFPSQSKQFQNILCWSLSGMGVIQEDREAHFKTSYVEVYLQKRRRTGSARDISKHLMLKFIDYFTDTKRNVLEFQNILCWSLSLAEKEYITLLIHFKTSYVEVYLKLCCSNHSSKLISKHLMLKFIVVLRF